VVVPRPVVVANASLDLTDPTGMSLAVGAIPEDCRDSNSTPMTPELSGRKGRIAQMFVGLIWRGLHCSIIDSPGGVATVGAKVAIGAPALLRDVVATPAVGVRSRFTQRGQRVGR
jgi:hypothetical protein